MLAADYDFLRSAVGIVLDIFLSSGLSYRGILRRRDMLCSAHSSFFLGSTQRAAVLSNPNLSACLRFTIRLLPPPLTATSLIASHNPKES